MKSSVLSNDTAAGLLPLVLPSVARVLPVSGNKKNGVLARKTKVKICVLPMLPNIIYSPYAFRFFLSLSLLCHFFYKLYFLAATAATAATWRNYAIGAATVAATKFEELATKIWGLVRLNGVIKPFIECCQ